MKKIFLVIPILLLIILHCFPESGFRGIPWGSSYEEILKAEAENNPLRLDYQIRSKGEAFGMRADVVFHYLDTGLYKGEYEIFASVLDKDGIIHKYNQIRDELTKEYREPIGSVEGFEDYLGYKWEDQEMIIKLLMEFVRGYQINIEYVQK